MILASSIEVYLMAYPEGPFISMGAEPVREHKDFKYSSIDNLES